MSPAEQRDRVVAACQRDGLVLVETINEFDVSGGTALDRRPGLRRAVEAIEAGAPTSTPVGPATECAIWLR